MISMEIDLRGSKRKYWVRLWPESGSLPYRKMENYQYQSHKNVIVLLWFSKL